MTPEPTTVWCPQDKCNVTLEWTRGLKTANMGVLDVGICPICGQILEHKPSEQQQNQH